MCYFVDVFDNSGRPVLGMSRRHKGTYRISVRLEKDPIDTIIPVPTDYLPKIVNFKSLIEAFQTLPKATSFVIQISMAVLEKTSAEDLSTLFSYVCPKIRTFQFHPSADGCKGIALTLNKTASKKSKITWQNQPLHLVPQDILFKLIDALGSRKIMIVLTAVFLSQCTAEQLRFLTTLYLRMESIQFECSDVFDKINITLRKEPMDNVCMDWTDEWLSMIPIDLLIKLIKSMSPKVTDYVLKNSNLFLMPHESLRRFFVELPPQVRGLSLAQNTIPQNLFATLPRLMSALPQLVTLDLSRINGVAGEITLPAGTFKDLLQLLPRSLKNLYLQRNNLDQYYLNDLVAILLITNPNIVVLDLTQNNFHKYSCAYIRAIGEGLVKRTHPTVIETPFFIKLILQEVKSLAENAHYYPLLHRLKLNIKYFPSIGLLFLTQQLSSAEAHLTLGLYLTDKIFIKHADLEVWQQSREARMHLALSYFLKAYSKPSLRNAVHLLLWQMGEGLDLPDSFADRLGRLNTPHPSSFVPTLPKRIRRTVGFFTPIPNEGRVFNASEDDESENPVASNQATLTAPCHSS